MSENIRDIIIVCNSIGELSAVNFSYVFHSYVKSSNGLSAELESVAHQVEMI